MRPSYFDNRGIDITRLVKYNKIYTEQRFKHEIGRIY